MILFFIFIFLMLGLLFFILKRDILYPAVTVNFIFAIVLIGYELSSDIYIYPLHIDTLLFVLSSLILFSLSSYLTESLLVNRVYKAKVIPGNINPFLNSSDKRLAFIVVLLSFFYMIMRLNGYVFGTNLIHYLNEIRKVDVDVEGNSRNLIFYLEPFMLVAFAMYILNNNIGKIKLNRITNIFIISIFLLATLLNTGKQIVFMVIISYCCITNVSRAKHYFYLALSVFTVFIVYMFLIRGLGESIAYYLSMYLVSPLIAFQQFYFENHTNYAVSHFFWFFERVWALISGEPSMSLHKESVWVGLPTNVYTAFSDYFSISPALNYAMMIIHGGLSGLLWRVSKNNICVKIFYSYFIYTFAFMFYHESFIVNISSWLQIIIAIFVINSLLKFRVQA